MLLRSLYITQCVGAEKPSPKVQPEEGVSWIIVTIISACLIVSLGATAALVVCVRHLAKIHGVNYARIASLFGGLLQSIRTSINVSNEVAETVVDITSTEQKPETQPETRSSQGKSESLTT